MTTNVTCTNNKQHGDVHECKRVINVTSLYPTVTLVIIIIIIIIQSEFICLRSTDADPTL